MNQRSYYRVMLGQKSVHAAECFADGFIGADLVVPRIVFCRGQISFNVVRG